jgi:hypothetical protein
MELCERFAEHLVLGAVVEAYDAEYGKCHLQGNADLISAL